MNAFTRTTLFLTASLFLHPGFLTAADKIARKDLGRSVKLTVLVDKVMQPQADWVTEEWMVREAAQASFNVFSPRAGYDRHDEVRRVAAWCKKYGIYHMPWMRGTLTAPDGPRADGKRVVWASGNQQALWSPNSDEFWQWTNRHIIEYAKISRDNPHLMGVFLDYENYAPRKEGNLYELSYDDTIMGMFAKSKGIELPRLDFDKRKNWLESQKLHKEFSQFQINHWRQRCRALRKAVDRLDPAFQFCIYPAPGSTFMVEATYPEWSTEQAPIILADASVYGRPGRFLSQKDSLAGNRERLLKRMEVPRKAGVPFIYSGGIDPLVRGADPEFSGKNAVMISDVTDGYWIFYEGPTYTKADHADYWRWFTWANKAIAKGDFDVQHEPRQTPTDWGQLQVFKQAAATPNLTTMESSGRETKYPSVQLRGENLLLLACRAGQPVAVKLANRPVGKYDCMLAWEVRRVGGGKITSGTIPHASQGTVAFTPDKDGVYLLGASSGSCSWSVQSSNVAVGMYAREWLKLIRGAKRLYFQVPATLKQFTITIKGAGVETVRANVFDPDGKQVATAQTSIDKHTVKINVPTGKQDVNSSGTVWSIQTTRADQGTLEDYSIQLDAKLAPTLSFVPKQVFGVKK